MRWAKVVALATLLLSCARKPAQVDSKFVLVPFEYLGSTPNLEWAGTALPGILSAQTSSTLAPHLRDAQISRTAQVVEGYVTGSEGDLRVTAVVRNEPSQTTVRTIEARGTTALETASALAKQLTAQPKPYGTTSPEAVKQLFSGNPEAALAADPNFGAAHIARIEALVRAGKKDEIPAAIKAAKSAKLTDLDQARLQTLVADTPKARAQGLLALARASANDLQYWRAAAEAALTAKDHPVAVEAFQKATEIDPTNIVLWNTLAYAQAFNGDIEGAKSSIAEYRRLQPKDANALDSLGEIYFFNGRFADAEKSFLESFELNNALLGGAGLYRAALSRFLAGDPTKADELFRRYLQFREQHKDPITPIREAIWLYTTGRKDQARQKLATQASPIAKSQLAMWDLAEGKGNPAALGDRPELQGWKLLFERRYPEAAAYWGKIYDNTSLVNGNEARMLLAWAGRNELFKKWPLPPSGPDPGLSSVAMAKVIELKAAGR